MKNKNLNMVSVITKTGNKESSETMKIKKIINFILIFFYTGIFFAFAESPVNISVDKNEIFSDEQIVLTVTIQSADGSEQIILPETDFFTMQGAGQSSQTSIINGKMSSSISYNYVLNPNKTGNINYAPINAVVKNKQYSLSELNLKVLPASDKSRNDSNQSPSERVGNNELMVKLTIDKIEMYVDEPVLLKFQIYRREDLNLREANYDLPQLSDFMMEKGEQTSYEKIMDGMRYEVIEVRSVLYPSKPGEFTINPATLDCKVIKLSNRTQRRRPSIVDSFFNDPFSDDFFGRNMNIIPVRKLSNDLKLKVLEIPKEGKLPDFSGNVGSYKLEVSFSPLANIKKGDAITLNMVVEGTGHITSVKEPELLNMRDFKAFESEVEIQPLIGGEKIAGRKIFKKIIVPEKAGNLKLPDVRFTFFDPYLKKYVEIKKEGQTVEVQDVKEEKGSSQVVQIAPQIKPGKKTLEITGFDIIYLNTDPSILKSNAHYLSWLMFFGIFISGAIFCIIIFIFLSYQNRLSTDTGYRRSKNAYSSFAKKISRIKSKSNSVDKEMCGLTNNAISEYFSDKLNIPSGTWTPQDIDSKLSHPEIPKEMAKALKDYLIKLDMFQFGGMKVNATEWKAFLKEIENTVKQIEGLKIWK